MGLVNEFFSACTNARLEAEDVYLPLDNPARADLLNILSEPDSYAILTISNERTHETVKARNVSGTIILERGLEGTQPVLHRFGSNVCGVSPTTMAVIKDLICNYTCCEPEDCPCDAVEFGGSTLPAGNVGKYWQGSIVFKGSLPINTGVNNTPEWMQVIQQSNSIFLYGTPEIAGEFTFSVAAANCNGTQIDSASLTVIIQK